MSDIMNNTPIDKDRLKKELSFGKRAGVNKSNIFAFIQECERANNFGKYYNWRVKQKLI